MTEFSKSLPKWFLNQPKWLQFAAKRTVTPQLNLMEFQVNL